MKQKLTAQRHTTSNNTEDLDDIINMLDMCVSEWIYVI